MLEEQHTRLQKDRNTTYPVRDTHRLVNITQETGLRLNQIAAVWTGEKRCPKAGEWFLSGAIVGAFYTSRDLTTPYYIARLVKVTTVTHTVVEELT